MNSILGWFITFNFVNITFIFFRANDLNDAVKVLSSMFSLDNIVLPDKLASKLAFLNDYGIEFGNWTIDISGSNWTAIWIIFAFILVLFFKNSMEKWKEFRLNSYYLLYTIISLFVAISFITRFSEFLYFNF